MWQPRLFYHIIIMRGELRQHCTTVQTQMQITALRNYNNDLTHDSMKLVYLRVVQEKNREYCGFDW